jgi:tryptophan synthase alpha subunit
VCARADGAIVGSALVATIAAHADNNLTGAVTTFVRELKTATRRER